MIDEMSDEELETLSKESDGITKTLWLSYKRKKITNKKRGIYNGAEART